MSNTQTALSTDVEAGIGSEPGPLEQYPIMNPMTKQAAETQIARSAGGIFEDILRMDKRVKRSKTSDNDEEQRGTEEGNYFRQPF